MKVFLSWSGDAAKKLAALLMDWLPNVIQSVEPWTSEEIGKGARWSDEIAAQLEVSRFGILCLDREHLASPWIHFEAGAIAKSVRGAAAKSRVTPLLLGIDEGDLRDPLALFQATKLDEVDMFRLVRSLNELQDEPLELGRLEKAFRQWWPDFERRLGVIIEAASEVEEPKTQVAVTRSEGEVLEELLHLAREQRRTLSRLEQSVVVDRIASPADDAALDWRYLDERVSEVQRQFLGLGMDVSLMNLHSDESMTVELVDTPSQRAITALAQWAAANGWDITLETPDGVRRVGVLRRP